MDSFSLIPLFSVFSVLFIYIRFLHKKIYKLINPIKSIPFTSVPLDQRRTIPHSALSSLTATQHRYLVTGAHGFVGSHVVEALLSRGENHIILFDKAADQYQLFQQEIKQGRVVFIEGDITNYPQLLSIMIEYRIDAIFHIAALVDFWSRLPHQLNRLWSVNVVGTENIIKAAKESKTIAEKQKENNNNNNNKEKEGEGEWVGVNRILYMSSASVCCDIRTDQLVNCNEKNTPYAQEPFINHYIHSKMVAEKKMLDANHPSSSSPLYTVAIRPMGIFGPRDGYVITLVPQCVPIISDFNGIMDYVHVENVVYALMLADQKLNQQVITNKKNGIVIPDEVPSPSTGSVSPSTDTTTTTISDISGRPYFIASDIQLHYQDLHRYAATEWGGEEEYSQKIFFPASIWWILCYISETLAKILPVSVIKKMGDFEKMTPGMMYCTVYNIVPNDSEAKKILGYRPIVGLKEGITKSVDYLRPFFPDYKYHKKNNKKID